MASRFHLTLLLSSGFLTACTGATRAEDEPAPRTPAATEAASPPVEALPSMCRMVRPADVVQEWAEVPEVRRGRVPSALAESVTPEERAVEPNFDGFRLGMVDYEWRYNEPTRSYGEQRPVQLDIAETASGFTATIKPGRNGRLLDDSGPKNEYEFLPDPGAPIVYTFERKDDCWVLVSATAPAKGTTR